MQRRPGPADLLDRPMTSGPQTQDSPEAAPPERPSIWKRMYIPDILSGMMKSIRHAFRPRFTVQYPEVRKELAPRFRGEHRLKVDEHGRMKCVACYMCATVCPAKCIHILATEAPEDWDGREKIPLKFEIDELRCIFCGYCVEACPKDAIEMTTKVPRVYATRSEFVYDMNKLMTNDGPSSEFALGAAAARKGPIIKSAAQAVLDDAGDAAALPGLELREAIPTKPKD